MIYSLFEPGPKEPTLMPFTDERNTHDYFLLSDFHVDTLSEGAKARIKDEYKYSNVVGMTVYNEDYGEMVESLRGVLLKGGKHNLELDKTVVVIVVDGCDILNIKDDKKKELRRELQALGLYDKKKVKSLRKHWAATEKPQDDVCFVFESDIALESDEYPLPIALAALPHPNFHTTQEKAGRCRCICSDCIRSEALRQEKAAQPPC